MKTNYRWGVLGTGYAAREFTRGLQTLSQTSIVAVGSESAERARSFAAAHGIARGLGSYTEVIQDPNIDIIYVGTLAPSHHPLCLEAIQAGKAVLCEKPFAMSAAQATEIAAAAKAKAVFCMEAMWTRWVPLMVAVQDRIRAGEIGKLIHIAADFGIRQTPQSNPRLFDPNNGGALRDLGVYPIGLAIQYLGAPNVVHAQFARDTNRVDLRASGALHFSDGRSASFLTSIVEATPTTATFIGTDGFIEVRSPMYRPTHAQIVKTSSPVGPAYHSAPSVLKKIGRVIKKLIRTEGKTLVVGYSGNAYQYQAIEVMHCLDQQKTESSVMPLSQSIELLKVIDQASKA